MFRHPRYLEIPGKSIGSRAAPGTTIGTGGSYSS